MAAGETDTCDICHRERPARAISLFGTIRYCNDNHNDTDCHERLNEKVGLTK